MCGIVGYIGPREAGPILHRGPRAPRVPRLRLGRASRSSTTHGRPVRREAGRQARQPPDGARRRARRTRPSASPTPAGRPTAGPNDLNAHPHVDCTGDDHGHPQRDHRELPGAPRRARGARPHARLRDRHRGASPTSSRRPTRATSPTRCARRCARLDGAYALVVHAPGRARPARRAPARTCRSSSGLGDGENFLASDVAAILAHTRRVIFLEEGDVADLDRGRRGHHRRRRRARRAPGARSSTGRIEAAEKGGYEHFMLKEIHEQPEALRQSHRRAGSTRDDRIQSTELEPVSDAVRAADAGRARRLRQRRLRRAHRRPRLLQDWTGLPARANVGSEFRYGPPPLDAPDAGHRGHPVGRDRRHDRPDAARPRARLPDHRGHQHGRLGHHPRGGRGPVPAGRPGDRRRGDQDVRDPGDDARASSRRPSPRPAARLADEAESGARSRRCGRCPRRRSGRSTLGDARRGRSPAATSTRAASCSSGAASTYPVALEGALKLKEVSYVHAEGYAAGELKHGPISLLDAECPLVAVATRSSIYDKLISNVMEGRARDARVIAVATEGDEAHRASSPTTSAGCPTRTRR